MRLDSGRGAVVFKNAPLISDTLLVGGVVAKHANGRDWILCHRFNSDLWYNLLLTPYGIQGPFSQHAGQFIYQGGGGQSVFSRTDQDLQDIMYYMIWMYLILIDAVVYFQTTGIRLSMIRLVEPEFQFP